MRCLIFVGLVVLGMKIVSCFLFLLMVWVIVVVWLLVDVVMKCVLLIEFRILFSVLCSLKELVICRFLYLRCILVFVVLFS